MSKLELYEKSIEKWKKVLLLLHEGVIWKAWKLAGEWCAFCKDVIHHYEEVSYVKCEECVINHKICAEGIDPPSDSSLVRQVFNTFNDYSSSFWIYVDVLLKATRRVLVALRKEWREEKEGGKGDE